ncbi:rhomboid protease [Malassezia yamatoensis]|uniref:Rhomboid protease n=1 Tax=Malassezia yamatoensis TaxID=253288 RepID=A0AAJ5YSZ0_9BASI|nr:rhomboid protease [Malassezia yamatoensis]
MIVQQSAKQNWTSMGSFFIDQYDTRRLQDTERDAQLSSLHKRLIQIKKSLAVLPAVVQEPIMRAALSLTEWYVELPSYKEAAIPVIAINTGVFALWMLAPRLRFPLFMQRHFTARPASGRVYTMLTSVFSHKAPAHFLFNNLALWSVGASSLTILASRKAWNSDVKTIPDVIPGPHFFAFFVTAGTFASLVSHLVTALRWRATSSILKQATRSVPRASQKLRADLSATIRLANTVLSKLAQRASLGSSGAIYAAFVLSALTYPQATLSLIFLPFTAIPIQWGMSG